LNLRPVALRDGRPYSSQLAMSTEELTVEEPRTRVCRTCSVEINAASARCPYCGARQFKRQPILGWRGLLVCLLAVAAAVLVTHLVIDAPSGALRYEPYRSASLVALVPSGYSDQLLAGPHGTAIAGFVNPTQAADSEQIEASTPAGGTPQARMLALAARLRNQAGVAEGSLGHVVVPGDVDVWELEYTLAGVDHAVFAFDACSQTIGVTVTLSTDSVGLLDELSLVLPQGAAPICDGPDFSNRDRADTSVPLRPAA
jgi:RNA polymerase subunit RPABC4/transcription elongation factor Spt4